MLVKDLREPEWYIGTVDACWINRMLVGCRVQIKRGCAVDRETETADESSGPGQKGTERVPCTVTDRR